MDGEILFLCHRIPFPPDRGDKIRSFHLFRALSKLGPVHVGTFADDDRDESFAPTMADWTASQCVARRNPSRAVAGLRGPALHQPMLVALYEHADLHEYVRTVLATRPITAVVGYSVQMAHFVPDLPPHVRFMMDFVDFDSAKYAAYGAEQGGPMGWVHRREGRMLFEFERNVARRADVSTFVSEAEASLFAEQSGLRTGIDWFDNGVDHDYFDPAGDYPWVATGDGPLIVFTGQMDYRPNIEAVESFARTSLPAIRAVHPQARFAIVGRAPTPQVMALADVPGVMVTGAVPDVRGWIAAADVVVAPLRIARGIQNKVLEAMAMARPVVASAEAAEGIDARHHDHLLIADTVAGEAELVLSLLADRAAAAGLGLRARARVIERYDWGATLSRLPDLLCAKGRAAA